MWPNYHIRDKSNQFKTDHNQKPGSNGESKCYRNVDKKWFSKTRETKDMSENKNLKGK